MHVKVSLSSHHRGELRIHVRTKPKVAHDKVVCYAARNGHIHRLGKLHTNANGKATRTFHHLKHGQRYLVQCVLSGTKHYKRSFSKPHHITIHN